MNRVEMPQPAKRCAAILGRLLTAEVRCNHSFGYLGVIGDDMPIRIYILAKQLNRPTAWSASRRGSNYRRQTMTQATLPRRERRNFVMWIHIAKRSETRERRIRESIALLAAGKKLGLK